MSAPETPRQPRPYPALSGVSMRDLLASCAAADVVSRPPREPEPRTTAPGKRIAHRKAA